MKLTQIKGELRKFSNGLRNVYFSYETPIAFYKSSTDCYIVSENVWTRTTGQHLSYIKKNHPDCIEVPHSQFTYELNTYY